MKINFHENSTKRGIVYLFAAIIGFPMVWLGKDVSQLILLAFTIAGALCLPPDTPKPTN